MIDTLYDLSQKSGKLRQRRRRVQCRPDKRASAGRARRIMIPILSAQGIRTDYWNWGQRIHQRLPAGSIHHAGARGELRRPEQPDLGAVLYAAQNPRPAGLPMRSAATRKRWRSRRAWAARVYQRLARAGGGAHQHVEPLHAGEYGIERSHGPPLSDHGRQAISGVRQTV